jgi:hypothetical protein
LAERVKRRLRVTKLSVSVAVAAVIAGFVAQDKGSSPVTYQLTGGQPHMTPGSITSRDIKQGSLLYSDFKSGQLYSPKETNRLFETQQGANATFVKIDDAANTFLSKDAAGGTYLDKTDAANTYLKIDDASSHFVNGDGSVFTGSAHVASQGVDLLTIPGFVGITASHSATGEPDSVALTNNNSSPLDYSTPTKAGTIAPGASLPFGLGASGPSVTIQMLVPAVQKVATLTISAIGGANGSDFVAQVLVGSS